MDGMDIDAEKICMRIMYYSSNLLNLSKNLSESKMLKQI